TDITRSGTKLGNLSKELSNELSIPQTSVISVCSHDTASAVVGIPSLKEDFLFISSGTWSLVGTELNYPVISDKSASYNITNESGYNNTTRYLKNITGLWLIQETQRQFSKEGRDYTFGDFELIAKKANPF